MTKDQNKVTCNTARGIDNAMHSKTEKRKILTRSCRRIVVLLVTWLDCPESVSGSLSILLHPWRDHLILARMRIEKKAIPTATITPAIARLDSQAASPHVTSVDAMTQSQYPHPLPKRVYWG